MLRSFHAVAVIALLGGMLAGCGGTRSATPAGDSSGRLPAANDPSVVAIVGPDVITLDEFEAEYAESAGGRAGAADDSLAEYHDFLNRYINFKLKVAAARAAGLAQDSSLQAEAASYRARMARPYLLEQEILEPIMRQLFDRMHEAVSTSHILIRVDENASPADTLAAYTRLKAIADSIAQGADFGTLALRHSEDPSARMEGSPGYRGDLGVLPPGAAVDEFEDMAYATATGQVSPIFRTQFGYHILKVNERKPAVPDRRIAHIMLGTRRPGVAVDTAAAADSLRMIKARIEAGEDFAKLAQQYSAHRESGQRGGQLDFWFNATQNQGVPPAFHEAIFALDEVGDVSGVVATPMGLHLIQLREVRPLGDYAAMKEQLRGLATRLPRTAQAQQDLLERTQREYGYTLDSVAVYNALGGIPADSLIRILREKRVPQSSLGQTFMTLGDSTYTIGDLAEFSLRTEVPRSPTTVGMLRPLVQRFAADATVEYAGAALETRNPEFGRLMEKFRSGLLLFRIMEDSVWTAASEDSVGLRAYYEARRNEYRFPERTRVVSFYAASDSVLNVVRAELAGGASVADIQARFRDEGNIQIDTVHVAGPTQSIFDQALDLQPGQTTEPVRQGRQFVLMLNDGQEAPRLKTFEEARPEVTTAYQEVLEQRLLDRLRRTYPVVTFPERLSQAYAGEDNSGATAAAR